jgi:hypothetical protein
VLGSRLGVAALIAGMALWSAPAKADSARKAAPHRHGIQLGVMAGPTLCVGAGPGGGRCNPEAATRSSPRLGVGGSAGWRFGPSLFFGVGGNLADRRSGESADGDAAFSDMRMVGAYAVTRAIWPLRRTDLSAELGVGWSRLQIGVRSEDLSLLESSGLALRPGLGIQQWLASDYAIGVRAEGLFNLHTWFCADGVCSNRIGIVPKGYRDAFFHGVVVGVDLAAFFYIRTNP